MIDAKFDELKRWVDKSFETLRRRIGQLTRKRREPRKGTRGPADKPLG